jgi:uncharacterized damage-inducible protein DinB
MSAFPPPSLSADETIAWVDRTSANWRRFLAEHPAVLALPCDVYKSTETVGGLLRHIVAAELRYAQRLAGVAETAYEEIPAGDAEAIYAVHDRAMAMLRERVADAGYDWEREIEFETITLGRIAATRRAVLFHLLLHGVRHYGQLATLVRQHGFRTSFPMDYLMMGARRLSLQPELG